MSLRRRRTMGAVALLLLVGGFALSMLPCLNRRHDLECPFARLPDDDEALIAWLERQPGILPHSVLVYRREEEPTVLMVSAASLQNVWDRPAFPDLDGACARLEYHATNGKMFGRSPRRGSGADRFD